MLSQRLSEPSSTPCSKSWETHRDYHLPPLILKNSLGAYSFVPQDLWFLTTQSYVKSRPLNLVVVLHSEWNIMNSHNLLGTMTSIMTSACHGIVLGVAGRANTCAALFHSVIIVFCRGQSSWVLWSCCPFILFKTFPAHSVSQNRHCPTNSNPQFSPFMNE